MLLLLKVNNFQLGFFVSLHSLQIFPCKLFQLAQGSKNICGQMLGVPLTKIIEHRVRRFLNLDPPHSSMILGKATMASS